MNNFELAKEYFLNGCTFLEAEDFFQAEIMFKCSLELIPNRASTLTNLSVAQLKLKKYPEAKLTAEKAILVEGDNSEAYLNLGLIEKELKSYEVSTKFFDKALSLKPDYHEAWSNKGNVLRELKRFDEAIAHYDKALSLKPDYHEAWANMGVTFNELKRFDEAIAHYDKALNLKPDMEWALGDKLAIKMKICCWSDLVKTLENISQKLELGNRISSPFPLLGLTDNALIHKKSAEAYIEDRYPFNPILGSILRRPKREKIRIGYFSTDFKNHPVSFLIAELFEIHDRSQFEIYAFSLVKAFDETRVRLQLAFDHFIDAEDMSDIEVAQLSRNLNIDIAVDLNGITQFSRTGIFSYRAAPIQVNYLGYPGSMGASYIDYIIADRVLISLNTQSNYVEKVVYLPNSYQVNDRKRKVSQRRFTRRELGLPEDGFIFCCFNNNFKILPEVFDGWMRILEEVQDSVLWLLGDNYWAEKNLKMEAQMRGIDAQRLIFAERVSSPEHLSRQCHADLFLDTLPYNAHTTTSDALRCGLPVLTLTGQSFASRVAASLLNAVGLNELITYTQKEYESLAIDLASNPKKLSNIKLKLTVNFSTAPLFDTPLFAKNLETAYINMMERYYADLKPDHLFIS